MKKKVFGRRLKRDRNERKALFRSLVTSLVLKGKIETTEQKAKAIKSDVDKMITMAKKGGMDFSSYVFPNAVEKLTSQVIPALNGRTSGYTRIVRKGVRMSDSARLVLMEWVDLESINSQKPESQKKVKKIKTSKPKTKAKAKPRSAISTQAAKKGVKNAKK
jgi:large subunit ribosomal protein L17